MLLKIKIRRPIISNNNQNHNILNILIQSNSLFRKLLNNIDFEFFHELIFLITIHFFISYIEMEKNKL